MGWVKIFKMHRERGINNLVFQEEAMVQPFYCLSKEFAYVNGTAVACDRRPQKWLLYARWEGGGHSLILPLYGVSISSNSPSPHS